MCGKFTSCIFPEIIKTLDIQNTAPDIVFFEHLHLSILDYNSCIDLFNKCNYKMYFQGRDTLAIKIDVWKNLEYLQ